MTGTGVLRISTCIIRHCRTIREEERKCHLNPWDLFYLSINYIQKGLLFRKPPLREGETEKEEEQVVGKEPSVITLLKRSLSATLDHFYPLCGRLATTEHPGEGTVSIFIDCNNEGIEFIHATAAGVTISDLLSPPFTPRIVRSFFPLNGAVGYDGHTLPLVAVQVTELQDGYFLGCSMNHSAVDGSSFWHFLNSWSAVARGGADAPGGIPLPPVIERWFPESLRPPLHVPLPRNPDDFIRRPVVSGAGGLEDTVFHFPQHAIALLKAKANSEVGNRCAILSSLQALLAFVWQATTRARNLQPQQATVYNIAVGLRQRLQPPQPQGYLGNLMQVVPVAIRAGELLGLPLGEVAMMLNRAIASQTETDVRSWAESWVAAPFLVYPDRVNTAGSLFTGSSPRFDMYGNDFGWGRPVAVRSGVGNKLDGKLTIYPGATEGSMELEMYLPREVLLGLTADAEFMRVASVGSAHLQVTSK